MTKDVYALDVFLGRTCRVFVVLVVVVYAVVVFVFYGSMFGVNDVTETDKFLWEPFNYVN